MAYIGFNPSQQAVAAFATKLFTGDGTTTTFTLDQSVPGANEANVEVVVENVLQSPIDAYTISGALNNQLVFSEAPSAGAAIYVIHKGEATYNLQPSTGSVTAATLDPVLRNFTVNTFTGTGSQTQFTLTDTPYSPNSILVMVDGIVQTASVNYTVSGTTLDFGATAPDNGSTITVVHLGFSSGNKAVMDASITPVKLSTGGPTWTTDYKVSMGSIAQAPIYDSVLTLSRGSSETYSSTTATPWPYTVGASPNLTIYNNIIGDNTAAYLTFRTGNSNGSANIGFIGTVATSGSVTPAVVFGQRTSSGYAERMRIHSNRYIGIGTDSPTSPVHIKGSGESLRIDSNTDPLYAYRYNVGSNGAAFFVGKSRGVNVGDMTAVQNGDSLLALIASGADGTNFQRAAAIYATIDATGTISTTSMPGKLSFQTSANGGVSPVERLYIDSAGVVGIPYGQIKFPAVQNASSDPNTLDDYEEGTHQTTVTIGSGTLTYVSRNLQYVKIGRQVTIWGRLHVNLSATSVTSFRFTLPFALAFGNGSSDETEVATVAQVIRATANTGVSGAGPDGIRIFRGISGTSQMTMQTADGGETGNFGVTNPHINFAFSYYTTA